MHVRKYSRQPWILMGIGGEKTTQTSSNLYRSILCFSLSSFRSSFGAVGRSPWPVRPSSRRGMERFGWYMYGLMFPKIVGFPPKSSILRRFSIINHAFWGTPIFGNTHIYIYIYFFASKLGLWNSAVLSHIAYFSPLFEDNLPSWLVFFGLKPPSSKYRRSLTKHLKKKKRGGSCGPFRRWDRWGNWKQNINISRCLGRGYHKKQKWMAQSIHLGQKEDHPCIYSI